MDNYTKLTNGKILINEFHLYKYNKDSDKVVFKPVDYAFDWHPTLNKVKKIVEMKADEVLSVNEYGSYKSGIYLRVFETENKFILVFLKFPDEFINQTYCLRRKFKTSEGELEIGLHFGSQVKPAFQDFGMIKKLIMPNPDFYKPLSTVVEFPKELFESYFFLQLHDVLCDYYQSLKGGGITYESLETVFTVREMGNDYILTFQKYPDELREIDNLGKVERVKVTSDSMPDYRDRVLFLPGFTKSQDENAVTIPKEDVSKDFFKRLTHLINDKLGCMKGLKNIKPPLNPIDLERILKACKLKSACVPEYTRLKTAIDNKEYENAIHVLKENIEWLEEAAFLSAECYKWIDGYEEYPMYLSHASLIEQIKEDLTVLVFEYSGKEYVHHIDKNYDGFVMFKDKSSSAKSTLAELVFYVKTDLARVKLNGVQK